MSDWSQSELEALERGAPMSVMGQIRARREVRAAAGLLDPADVDFGPALGLSRCGVCAHYQPSPENPMHGRCAIVDIARVDRHTWCNRFEVPAPSTSGAPGGVVALTPRKFLAMVAQGVPPPSGMSLIASNEALLGRVRMHRDSMAQRYGWVQPKVFARWLGGR